MFTVGGRCSKVEVARVKMHQRKAELAFDMRSTPWRFTKITYQPVCRVNYYPTLHPVACTIVGFAAPHMFRDASSHLHQFSLPTYSSHTMSRVRVGVTSMSRLLSAA